MAFATSPHGLGIPESKFWYMSFREYRAYERVWENSQRETKHQWASIMATLYNAHLRADGRPPFSKYDWLPGEDRPPEKKPWEVDYEAQKISIRAALTFAAEYNQAKAEQKPN